MVDLRAELSSKKDILKKNILIIQNIMQWLYQLNTKKINNKLIYIKRGVDKTTLAQKCIFSLKLEGFKDKKEDEIEIKELIKHTQDNIIKIENILKSKIKDQSFVEVNSFKQDMDYLRQAYAHLKFLDTDMNLTEKDFEAKDFKSLESNL